MHALVRARHFVRRADLPCSSKLACSLVWLYESLTKSLQLHVYSSRLRLPLGTPSAFGALNVRALDEAYIMSLEPLVTHETHWMLALKGHLY